MTPLAPMEPCVLLIVKPNVGVSTPEAYRQCDTMPDLGMRYTRNMVRAIERRSLEDIALCLGNRFDDALQLPQVLAIKALLRRNGAMNALMTGSGSAVFGIFQNEESALQAQTAAAAQFGETFLAYPISAEEAQNMVF